MRRLRAAKRSRSRENHRDPSLEAPSAHSELAPGRIREPTADVAESSGMDEKADRLLASLPPREQVVLCLRFAIGRRSDHRLEEIGVRSGVSRERPGQLESTALAMLRGRP